MSTSYISADVRCPFYKGDEGKKLICEGIDDKCNLHLEFKKKQEKYRRMEQFCTGNYKDCSLYRILEEKYEI